MSSRFTASPMRWCDVFDTLDMARRLYPTGPSHSLEHVAARLKIAHTTEHWALSDARLIKGTFLAMLKDIPIVKTIDAVTGVSPPRTFTDAPVFATAASRLRGALDRDRGTMRHRHRIRPRMETAATTDHYALSGAGGPWRDVCDRVLPYERWGEDLSA
jgi:DNA polymerase III epsilon subunit-like protein